MQIRELTTKEEMLVMFPIMQEMYPTITLQEYTRELDSMIPHNYGQVAVYEGEQCLGLTGYWLGSKLWCGKYLELDNVFISKQHRSKGVGKVLFDYMEKKAIDNDCTMMALDSYTDNFKAHKFFYKQNFVPRGFHFINVLQHEKVR